MFEFDVSNPALSLNLECWDEDAFLPTYLGGTTLSLGDLSNGEKLRNWFLLTLPGFSRETKGSVELGEETCKRDNKRSPTVYG